MITEQGRKPLAERVQLFICNAFEQTFNLDDAIADDPGWLAEASEDSLMTTSLHLAWLIGKLTALKTKVDERL
ncbi:MAG: hypothetical protein RBT62_11410 [Spirochaetia bacterium]|jgi:hypothetical protein|nr:hypothetical protein [Spirochaetia bacterium]